MLWTTAKKYQPYPYAKEADLEHAILEVEADLFGPRRIYLDVKKKIGARNKTNNIPDGGHGDQQPFQAAYAAVHWL